MASAISPVWTDARKRMLNRGSTYAEPGFSSPQVNTATLSRSNRRVMDNSKTTIKSTKHGAEPRTASSSQKVKIGISGGGPRAMNHIIALVALFCVHEEKLMKLRSKGVDFSIEITVFEKQPEKRGASGNAFQPECDATLNTGIPGRMKIPGLEKIADTHPTVYAATDLARTVTNLIGSDPKPLLNRYKDCNLAAYSMLRKALKADGKLNTSIPCLTRDFLGAGLTKNVNDVIDYANSKLSFFDIKIRYGMEVAKVDFANPAAPELIVKEPDGRVKSHVFDMVFLANGTPSKAKVPPSVVAKSYSQIPNSNAMKEFLNSNGLLDSNGKLKKGTKLAIVGASLAAYDYLNVLATTLGIVRPCSSEIGYEIDPKVAAEYQNLITIVNPTAGRATPPAISNALPGFTTGGSLSWPTNVPQGIGAWDEIHSTFLQNHFQAFPLFQSLTKANIARALGTVPGKVNESKSTKQRLADYQLQIESFQSGKSLTEWGFWKSSYLQVISGVGFSSNSKEAENCLSKTAPLTHTPFNLIRKYRSHISNFTDAEYVKTNANSKSVKVLNEVERLLGPSPISAQQMVNLLSEANVLDHVPGYSSQLQMSKDGKFVELGNMKFHAILAPKALSREADITIGSIADFVEEVAPGQPEYAKGRILVGKDGKLLNVYECGMVGEGTHVKNADGSYSLVGMRWPDTHGYSNLFELVCQAPYLTLSFALLKAANVSNPISHMQEYYESNLPDPTDFDAETAQFENAFYEILQKNVFLNLCEVLAGDDGAQYRQFTDHAFTSKDRASFVARLEKEKLSESETAALEAFLHQTTNPVRYQPSNMEKFYNRHVDFTQRELDEMLNEAIAQAVACAPSNRKVGA